MNIWPFSKKESPPQLETSAFGLPASVKQMKQNELPSGVFFAADEDEAPLSEPHVSTIATLPSMQELPPVHLHDSDSVNLSEALSITDNMTSFSPAVQDEQSCWMSENPSTAVLSQDKFMVEPNSVDGVMPYEPIEPLLTLPDEALFEPQPHQSIISRLPNQSELLDLFSSPATYMDGEDPLSPPGGHLSDDFSETSADWNPNLFKPVIDDNPTAEQELPLMSLASDLPSEGIDDFFQTLSTEAASESAFIEQDVSPFSTLASDPAETDEIHPQTEENEVATVNSLLSSLMHGSREIPDTSLESFPSDAEFASEYPLDPQEEGSDLKTAADEPTSIWAVTELEQLPEESFHSAYSYENLEFDLSALNEPGFKAKEPESLQWNDSTDLDDRSDFAAYPLNEEDVTLFSVSNGMLSPSPLNEAANDEPNQLLTDDSFQTENSVYQNDELFSEEVSPLEYMNSEEAFSELEIPQAECIPETGFQADPEITELAPPIKKWSAPSLEPALNFQETMNYPKSYGESIAEALDHFEQDMLLRDSKFLTRSINNLVDSYFAQQVAEI